ncbi:MAG: hypothetical protein J6S54_06015 [Lentisphaeria bacterium]|nr:hypothetical protein [Lentisphaeria bacterium]
MLLFPERDALFFLRRNGIDKAAKSAGITKISHVDSFMKSYFLGLYMKQTIKVYGE